VVALSWRTGVDAFAFEWTETGIEGLMPPSGKGFGARLIDQAIEYDLDGEIIRDFWPSGFHCALSIPIRKVLTSDQVASI
jgi:hypothetical protein